PNDPAKTDPGVCGCGYTDSDKNGDGVVDCGTSTSGLCIPGPSGAMDCAEEVLASAACAGANSFLGQINIATVLNLLSSPLNFTVKYIDAGGTVRGQVSTALAGNLKADFIINDLGLTPDTYGTVCVETDAAGDGAWTGGIALYKPNRREGPKPFGADFDFAIYHPFTNPRQGSMTVPLNTFHLGVNPADPVANWISITDATVGDGQGLSGKLRYYNSLGSLTKEDLVLIADGGRFDFSGHEGIAGLNSQDAVGMARFVPDAISSGAQAKYYLTVSRYFYDCAGTSCTNFLTAFSLPHRPGTEAKITGRASSLNGELSVLELTNTATSPAAAQYKLYAANGTLHGSGSAAIPVLGTTHIILNQAGASGYLPADSLGSIEVDAVSGYVSASILHYNFNASGELLYAYATPLVGPQKALQVSQFNSFIEHTNSLRHTTRPA
ncbi:MAG TPA: hypothetical protein PLP17_11965, partial [Oligoflexia bacterium]|nr:hypothetical protein [Oligoflexia bacterium]